MATFLSDEWHRRAVELGSAMPEVPGATVRVQRTVVGAAGSETRYVQSFVDGRLVEQRPGDDRDAELVLHEPLEDARALVDLHVGLMRGRVKSAGDTSRLYVLLPVIAGEPFTRLQTTLAAETT